MVVRLAASALAPFERCSLFDSPYPAHRTGRAIDLYPGGRRAPSPVAGTVELQRRVRAPTRPYAARTDVLTVIDTGEYWARILHVDPVVEPGDEVAVGDDLGELVRSGYFGPWVEDHLHVEWRERGADPIRASGSVPLALDVPIRAVDWDGTGDVVELGSSYVTLAGMDHPDPGSGYAGIGATAPGTGAGVLDGGLAHYAGGGLHGSDEGPVDLLGAHVGTARGDPSRPDPACIEWREVTIHANGTPVRGLACHLWRETVELTLVQPAGDFDLGERVAVTLAAP